MASRRSCDATRKVRELKVSSAFEVQNNFIDGIHVFNSSTNSSSSQTINRVGNFGTSAKEKDSKHPEQGTIVVTCLHKAEHHLLEQRRSSQCA